MAKEKYGAAFVQGIGNLREATGYVPKPKKVNMTMQTLKYLPGEMAKTTTAPFRWIMAGIKKRLKKK
jgi:hypothetical protein